MSSKYTAAVLIIVVATTLLAQGPYPGQPQGYPGQGYPGQQPQGYPGQQPQGYPYPGQPPQGPYAGQGPYQGQPQNPYPGQRPGPPPGGPAQQGPDYNQGPPERNVARISLINGEVSVRRGDGGDVTAAAMNAPIAVQDALLTSSSSRAEIQFDSANILRVGSATEVRMGDLQWKRYQIQIAVGTVTLRVLRNSDAQVELQTPILAVHPMGVGVYRITVREDGSSDVTVRQGQAEVSTQKGSERVQAGNTLMARGSATDPEFQIVAAGGLDDWDHWNENRDREFENARSRQYVSPDVYGAEDLDRYGQWVNDPSYGMVWNPQAAPGWAPYQSGRWVWEDYYGWTWVSSDPWGWAPYHYGRWFYGSPGWCWWPGPARQFWSPALVGFFGFGARAGIGFGFGSLGWVALAPFEAFRPWWGRGMFGGGGRTFVNNTTIINSSNLAGMYRNARVNNGVTAVSAGSFGRGASHFTSLNGAGIRDAGVVRGALPVSPTQASMRFADRAVNTAAFPQSRNQAFFSRGGTVQAGARSMSPSTQGRGFGGFGGQTNAGGSWQRFNGPAASGGNFQTQRGTQSYSPRPAYNGGAGVQTGRGGYQPGPSAPAYSPPRSYSAPSYSAPRSYSAPSYSAPRSSYSAPPSRSFAGSQAVRISPPIVQGRSSAPSYSPRSSGGGGGGSFHSSGGGGGSHGGGGGGGSHGGGGGGHGHR